MPVTPSGASFTETTAPTLWPALSAGRLTPSRMRQLREQRRQRHGDPMVRLPPRCRGLRDRSRSSTEIVDTVPGGGFSFAGPAGSASAGPSPPSPTRTRTPPRARIRPTINWGDGSSSAGTVGGGNGSFSVTGNHSYVAGGTYPITVTITAVGTNQGSSTVVDSATITAAPSTVITGVPTVSSSTKAGFAGSVNPEGLSTTTPLRVRARLAL